MPQLSHADPQSVTDLAACAAILRSGSKSFDAAARLLPARVRGPATALYAFCRVADDAIDGARDPGALEALRLRLDRAYAGQPETSSVDRAFSAVVLQRRIPRAIPDALLEGFAWDAAGRRYANQFELEAYAVRVAGTVGLMMAMVMGVRNDAALARAVDLGVAMQLTNIARDVGEDARNGRLYLPLDWLSAAGVDGEAFMRRPAFRPEIAGVVRRLLDLARTYYARADDGVAALPMDCRPAIAAARRIYAAIGDEITRAGFDSVTRRAHVSSARKLLLLIAATGSVAAVPRRAEPPAILAARPLLFTVRSLDSPHRHAPASFGERVGGVAEAFARLERRTAPSGVEAG